jgi:hypothetical protein
MADLTDTQRLDFIFDHRPMFDEDNRGPFMVFRFEGHHCVSRGKTYRQCIDNVTTGNYKYTD